MQNDSRMLKEGTEEDREGCETQAQVEGIPKKARHKRETGRRYKKNELVVVVMNLKDEQTRVVKGTLQIKYTITE
jgi:hypothetical protein